VYDPAKRQYLFLAYLLSDASRHKRKLTVHCDLFDVNNPTVALKRGRRPSIAMLFELEFATHQQKILDQARREAGRWKEKPEASSGCVRSATLHAHYAKERQAWWFEVHLAIGFKPSHIIAPEHVVGIHIDPVKGWFVTVLCLDSTLTAQFQLDEHTIATWLENKDPTQQAQIKPERRTAKERQHRIADVLVAICHHYGAQLGMENIAYRRNSAESQQLKGTGDSSRTVFTLLSYKLARANLPDVADIKNVAPKRDCGRCGQRHVQGQVLDTTFTCSYCGHIEDRHANTAREVARRTLWILAQKQRPKSQPVA
jgi:hypothetical protein